MTGKVIEIGFGPQTTPEQMYQIEALLNRWGKNGSCPFEGLLLSDAVAVCMAALQTFYVDTVEDPCTIEQVAKAFINEAQDVLDE